MTYDILRAYFYKLNYYLPFSIIDDSNVLCLLYFLANLQIVCIIFGYKNHECIVNIIVKIIKINSPGKQTHCIVNQFSTCLHKENGKEKMLGRNVMYNGNECFV